MGHCKKNEEKASEQEHKKHRSALRALNKGTQMKVIRKKGTRRK